MFESRSCMQKREIIGRTGLREVLTEVSARSI